MIRVNFVPRDPIPASHYNGLQQAIEGAIRTLGGLLTTTGGYLGSPTNNASVQESSPQSASTVKVKGPATLWIAPITGGTPPGVPWYTAADIDVAVPALNTTAGQSRNDLVVATVNFGSPDTYTFQVVQGTPATTGTQTDPAVPSNSIALARITRVHATTLITNAMITDIRKAVSVASQLPTVASAATITVPANARAALVSGTTGITSITAGPAGMPLTLIFQGILTVTDGSNLKLAGNFTTAANATLSLISDGTNWIETSRATT